MLDALLGPTIRQVKSPLTDKMLAPLDARCKRIQFDSLLTDADFERLAAFFRAGWRSSPESDGW